MVPQEKSKFFFSSQITKTYNNNTGIGKIGMRDETAC
jgi:hypothetical protein